MVVTVTLKLELLGDELLSDPLSDEDKAGIKDWVAGIASGLDAWDDHRLADVVDVVTARIDYK